ncbi:MAG: pilus assembly protein PilM [bacterium]
MFPLGRKKQPLVGIDISSTSIKLIELSQAGSGYRVETYSVEPLPAGSVAEKQINDVSAVGSAIAKALARAETKATRCALAVPSSASITKVITMAASLSEADIEAQIQLEADQYIPFPIEEVNLDFEVIGENASSPELIDVLLAASRSENIESRCATAEAAGLEPAVVDIEPFATATAFELIEEDAQIKPDDVAAIIDIGATMASITVVHNGLVIYTREQRFGGQQLTEDIMRRYGLSYAEAGLAKKEGGLPDDYMPEILTPFTNQMAQQIHRLLQFFFAASPHESVQHILLAGGCASIPGIDEIVETQLDTPTLIANPFRTMTFSKKVNQQRLGNDAPAMMIACGLAMRGAD